MRSHWMLVLLAALATASVPGSAWAQSDAARSPSERSGEPARWDNATPKQTGQANTAYQAGVKLVGAKRYDDALTKFRESHSIVANPNTSLMIVRTLNEAGRSVEAYNEGVEALKEAQEAAAQAPDKHQRTVDDINKEIEAAKAKIALLTVTVSGASAGATVTVGGRKLTPSEVGQAIAVQPGDVDVVLQAAEGNDTEKVKLSAGGAATVTLSPSAAVKAPPPAPPPPRSAPPKDEGSSYRGPDRLMLAIIAGGVGVLGFIGFGTFGLLSNARFERLETACDNDDFCDPALEDQADKGRAYQIAANVGLVVGIVGVAAGAGLFMWDFFDPEAEQTALRLTIGPTGAGLHASF